MRNLEKEFVQRARDMEYLYKILKFSTSKTKERIEELRLRYLDITKREIENDIFKLEISSLKDSVELTKVFVNLINNIGFFKLINTEENKEIIEFCNKQSSKTQELYNNLEEILNKKMRKKHLL